MAIQLPNNKISRTLPEQVGFNSAKIEEIIKFLNESGLKDLVISVDAASGTLTSEQYAITELSPSYVLYGGKVYVKALEDLTNIDYFQVGVDISGSAEYQASIERIRVVRDTRAFAAETVNLFESYTSDQIDTLLAVKADLSGANFTGAITGPSITETMTGYSFTKNDDEMTPSGLSLSFVSVSKTGNKITFAVAGSFLPATGLSIQQSVRLGSFTIPSAVGTKLIPISGTSLGYGKLILVYNSINVIEAMFNMAKVSDTQINPVVYNLNSSGFVRDQKYNFRFEATYLLGENLVS